MLINSSVRYFRRDLQTDSESVVQLRLHAISSVRSQSRLSALRFVCTLKSMPWLNQALEIDLCESVFKNMSTGAIAAFEAVKILGGHCIYSCAPLFLVPRQSPDRSSLFSCYSSPYSSITTPLSVAKRLSASSHRSCPLLLSGFVS